MEEGNGGNGVEGLVGAGECADVRVEPVEVSIETLARG